MKLSDVEAEPLVATTAAVVEPVGVPPVPPPPPPPPPLPPPEPPPPQLVIAIRPAKPRTSKAKAAPERRRRPDCDLSAIIAALKMHSSVTMSGILRPDGADGRDAGTTELGAVVVTVTVVVALVVVEVSVAVAGAKLQVAPVGRFAQVKVTVPVKPFCAVTVAVKVPELPGDETLTVGLADVTVNPVAKAATRFAAFTLPRPVAVSYPTPAL